MHSPEQPMPQEGGVERHAWCDPQELPTHLVEFFEQYTSTLELALSGVAYRERWPVLVERAKALLTIVGTAVRNATNDASRQALHLEYSRLAVAYRGLLTRKPPSIKEIIYRGQRERQAAQNFTHSRELVEGFRQSQTEHPAHTDEEIEAATATFVGLLQMVDEVEYEINAVAEHSSRNQHRQELRAVLGIHELTRQQLLDGQVHPVVNAGIIDDYEDFEYTGN